MLFLFYDIVTALLHWKCCAMDKWINIISYQTKPSCSRTEFKRCTTTEIHYDARTSPVVSTVRKLPNSSKNWRVSLLIAPIIIIIIICLLFVILCFLIIYVLSAYFFFFCNGGQKVFGKASIAGFERSPSVSVVGVVDAAFPAAEAEQRARTAQHAERPPQKARARTASFLVVGGQVLSSTHAAAHQVSLALDRVAKHQTANRRLHHGHRLSFVVFHHNSGGLLLDENCPSFLIDHHGALHLSHNARTVQYAFYSYISIFTLLINWLIKRHKVVTSEAPFLPRDGRNHLGYSLHLPTEGWPGWVGLSGRNKYRDGKKTRQRSSPIAVLTGLDVAPLVWRTPLPLRETSYVYGGPKISLYRIIYKLYLCFLTST